MSSAAASESGTTAAPAETSARASGTAAPSAEPSASVPARQLQALALGAGQLHTLLVHADGRLFVCGDNTYGQLGVGNEAPQHGFMPVAIGGPAVAATGGAYHSVVLTAGGKVVTFGRNAFGQLGTGGTVNSPKPQVVAGLPEAAAVAAGAYHTLVLGRDGSVWSFGDNTKGQCGPVNGENVQNDAGQLVARRVVRPQRLVDRGARAIAAGAAHSLILMDNGQVLACGANDRGQLGDGTSTGRSALEPVSGIPPAIMIAAGSDHSLIVTSPPADKPGSTQAAAAIVRQALYAFGDNSLGQLGSGSDYAPEAQTRTPVQADWSKVSGSGWDIRMLAAGYGNSLLVLEKGASATGSADPRTNQILIWGSNAYGQLGTGSDASHDKPIPLVAIDQGYRGDTFLPIEAVAIGGGHILIASRRGLLGGAGRNSSGQLGVDGSPMEPSFTGIDLPTVETGRDPASLDQIRAASFGSAAQDSRNPSKVLPLQVPWDTAYAYGENSVPEPADPRRPYLIAAAVLFAAAVLLALGMAIDRHRRSSAKRLTLQAKTNANADSPAPMDQANPDESAAAAADSDINEEDTDLSPEEDSEPPANSDSGQSTQDGHALSAEEDSEPPAKE